MIQKYRKLIRDRISDIIEANGQAAHIRVLSNEEYAVELKKKLTEEVGEYLASGETVELADILEVIQALAELQGVSFEELLQIKAEKQRTIGTFRKKLFLESVEGLESCCT